MAQDSDEGEAVRLLVFELATQKRRLSERLHQAAQRNGTKLGRPFKTTQMERLADGLTIRELCSAWGVCRDTAYRRISEAVKKGYVVRVKSLRTPSGVTRRYRPVSSLFASMLDAERHPTVTEATNMDAVATSVE